MSAGGVMECWKVVGLLEVGLRSNPNSPLPHFSVSRRQPFDVPEADFGVEETGPQGKGGFLTQNGLPGAAA